MTDRIIFPDVIKVRRLNADGYLPTRAHKDDAGLDLYCSESVFLPPEQGAVVKTGIAMAVPVGFVGLIADRSSLAKRGLKTAGGVIDAGYRGEVMIVLRNVSKESVELKRGERVAQLLIVPVATPVVQETEDLDSTTRGDGGFGSTGK